MEVSSKQLSPSELVLLNGEKFAAKAGVFNKVRLLHLDQDVDMVSLAQVCLATAFLANEQAGALRLEIRQKKALLGLASTQALYADPASQLPQWPANSLEAAMPAMASQEIANKHPAEVYRLVHTWLGKNFDSPFDEVLDRVKFALALRGLLEIKEERKLKIFVKRTYALPPETRALAASQSLAPVQQMLEACQQSRPQIWKALLEQVKKAVSARQEKQDVDID
jgi:hypothetical protein